MFTDEKTGNVIHANLNESLSHATMRNQDLIPRFLSAIRETPEYAVIINAVPSYANDDDGAEYWYSEEATDLCFELFDILDSYSPEGFYFGAHIGDGSDYGYWENEED